MKKILLVTILVLVVVMGMASVASANGGPHGGYTATTDACAGCHRTHTALGPRLLIQNNTFALCMSCHGNAGNGADTNVTDGLFLLGRGADPEGEAQTANNGLLLAGGFTNFNAAATTSSHDVSNTITDAWGNGVNRGASAALFGGEALNCASCHDPHGSTNYRIIKTTINNNPVVVTQVDEGAAVKDYDDENWPADLSNVCAACHGTYHIVSAGSGSDAAVAVAGGYTHRVDMPFDAGVNAGAVDPEVTGYLGFNLPLAGTNVVCSTCHLSHGSSSAMAGFADGGPTGAGIPPGNTTAADSALLRLDNRGVCEVCHQK